MAESPKTKPAAELTLSDAAKLVDKPLEDCLSFKDYGDTVVVVTIDGQKITVAKNVS
jgi:hypothetical protein